MLDTREGTHHHHHHHHMSHHHLHAKAGAGSAVVERPTTPQQPQTGASPRQAASSSSPILRHVSMEEDDFTRRGEKKGRVKHVGRGRKRHLDPDVLDSDYTTTTTSTSTTPTMTTAVSFQPAVRSAPPAKRARTAASGEEEAEVVEAPRRTVSEERQSTGCTDEDYVYRPRSVKDEAKDEDEEESQVEEEEVEETQEEEQVECFEVPHPAPRTWVAKAEWALGQLGGRGTLADIYTAIEEAFPEEIEGKRNWKAAIRSCLSKNEKNKFYKPHPPLGTAKSDHVWCLASAPAAANSRQQRRSRPAGRTRSSSATTSSTAQVSRQPRSGRRRSLPTETKAEEKRPKTEQQEPMELVERHDDGRRDEESRDNEDAELRQLESLLRRKQELEQDITRLEEEEKEQQDADGLSTEQEAFLSQILG